MTDKPEPKIVEGIGKARVDLSRILDQAEVKSTIVEAKLRRYNEKGELIAEHIAEFPDGDH